MRYLALELKALGMNEQPFRLLPTYDGIVCEIRVQMPTHQQPVRRYYLT